MIGFLILVWKRYLSTKTPGNEGTQERTCLIESGHQGLPSLTLVMPTILKDEV